MKRCTNLDKRRAHDRIRAAEFRKNNPELSRQRVKAAQQKRQLSGKLLAADRAWRAKVKDQDWYKKRNNEQNRRWRVENPEKWKDSRRKAYLKFKAANPEQIRRHHKNWKAKNRVKVKAEFRAYLARKIGAMPKWANSFFINEIYDLARLSEKHLGSKWHVDHIVPLRHPLVCGLHWERNLRVIPARSNLLKSNCVWPDMPT